MGDDDQQSTKETNGDAAGVNPPYASAEEQLFRRTSAVESSRRWGLIRGHLAVAPVSPSNKGNLLCDVVDASTGGRFGNHAERWNTSQQLWMAARQADAAAVARLLYGEEAKLVVWQQGEGKWRVRLASDGSERLVPPNQLIGDVLTSQPGSNKSSSSDYSRSTTCGVQSRGSTRESFGCRGGSSALSFGDATGLPPHMHRFQPSSGSTSHATLPQLPQQEAIPFASGPHPSEPISVAASNCGTVDEASPGGCNAAWSLAPGMAVRVLSANAQQVRVDWEMHRDKAEALVYKNRRLTCQALHAAVAPRTLVKSGDEAEMAAKEKELKDSVRKIVYMLLHARADASAIAKVDNKSGSGQPQRELQAMHMAAGAGGEDVIRMLVAHRADVQAPAKSNGEYHYVPLHDAVWFDQRLVARTLVELHANVDAKNGKGETPLHLAAHLGHVEMVAALLLLDDGRELLKRTCNKKWTPLDVALQSARFPPRKLYLFTHKMCSKDKAEAFLKVARICPMVAPELLRDDSVPLENFQERNISRAWRENLQEAAEKLKVITAQHLASLVEVAPLAAIELVDALTATPPVEDSKHHPLPFRANVPWSGEACRLSCAYVPDSMWHWHADGEHTGKAIPRWHMALAPENPKYGQEVEIKILKLPGVLNLDLMHVLAVSSEHVIFGKLAIHAVLRCAWRRTRWIHSIELLIQGAAMICMVLWVVCPDLGRLGERLLWCIVAAEAGSECLLIAFMTWRCLSLLGVRKWSQWAVRILLRCVLAIINLALAVKIRDTMRPQAGDMLFASSVLLHWVHFLWELRTFRATGKRLLPMMRALMLLGGMLVVLFFLTVAFAHAFWAMAGDTLLVWDLFSVLKLLFTGEVDSGIDPLDATLPTDQKVFLCVLANGAIVVFLVCFVNLFIAVLSDNYQAEQERLIFTLFRERAHVCCNLFLAPRAGGHWVATALSHGYRERYVIGLFVSACLVGSIVWVALVFTALEEEIPGFVAVCVAAFGILVLQGFVRGYLTSDFNEDCHLWVCHDKSFEEAKLLLTEDHDPNTEVQGRIARLRNYIHEQIKLVGLSVNVNKNILLKRHNELELLVGQVFFQLNEVRIRMGGSADLRTPLALAAATPHFSNKLSPLSRGSLKRVSRLTASGSGLGAGNFMPCHSELERRRQMMRESDAILRDNARGGATTPGLCLPVGSARGGADCEPTGDFQWPEGFPLSFQQQGPDEEDRTQFHEAQQQPDPDAEDRARAEELARFREGFCEAEQHSRLQEGRSPDMAVPAAVCSEEQSVAGDGPGAQGAGEVQGLQEEIRALRTDLLHRDDATRCLREDVAALRQEVLQQQRERGEELRRSTESVQALHKDVAALREELQQERQKGEELRKSMESVHTLREDIGALRADVLQQRAEGHELRRLVEQVLLRFDGALAAAATGQEILRLLPPELRPQIPQPRIAPDGGSSEPDLARAPVFAPRSR